MQESKVTAKGQTTLPQAVRAALDLRPGDRVRYVLLGNEVRLVKVRPAAELAGLLARPGRKPVALREMDEAIAAAAAERAALKA
jgi:AbrB family looped-hinge helix DNA binding protein